MGKFMNMEIIPVEERIDSMIKRIATFSINYQLPLYVANEHSKASISSNN
jgi:hypothetical protein